MTEDKDHFIAQRSKHIIVTGALKNLNRTLREDKTFLSKIYKSLLPSMNRELVVDLFVQLTCLNANLCGKWNFKDFASCQLILHNQGRQLLDFVFDGDTIGQPELINCLHDNCEETQEVPRERQEEFLYFFDQLLYNIERSLGSDYRQLAKSRIEARKAAKKLEEDAKKLEQQSSGGQRHQ